MFCNINNRIKDNNYRYKMPVVEIQMIGRGNGCLTNIKNLYKISESLNYPPSIILKFISKNIGCISNENDNTITGHHKIVDIQ